MGVPTPQYSASSDGRVMLWRGHEPAAYVDAAAALTAIGLPGVLGAWTAYTPTATPISGAFTSASTAGRYLQIGKIVFYQLSLMITTNGTAATGIMMSLPVACKDVFVFFGREDAVTGAPLQAKTIAASTNLSLLNLTNTYPGGNGYKLVFSGSYEAS